MVVRHTRFISLAPLILELGIGSVVIATAFSNWYPQNQNRYSDTMKNKFNILLPLFSIFISTNVYALCEYERGNGNTITINECYSREEKKSDAELMRVYSGYKRTLESMEQKRLLELQRSWVSYKMKQCDYEVISLGTIAGQIGAQCSIDLNKRRIQELKYMENCNLAESSSFCKAFRPL